MHPPVLELTGIKEPADGLHAKFSVFHGRAAGLVFGRAGEPEYADEAAADVTAVLRDGRRIHLFVEHAIGSLERPLDDTALAAKFSARSDLVLGAAPPRPSRRPVFRRPFRFRRPRLSQINATGAAAPDDRLIAIRQEPPWQPDNCSSTTKPVHACGAASTPSPKR